jgi:peptidyl-prolyl cis-trans isomerase B (cyclophilin B)
VASSKREKELARQRAERQAARRAAAATRRKQRNAVLASVLAVVLVAGAAIGLSLAAQSGPDDALADADANPSASLPPGSCLYSPTADPASKPVPLPPAEDVEDEQAFTATLTTSQGPIVLELDSAAAPCTVNSFVSLAQAEFFADTPCHRLLTGESTRILQCGDPTGTGTGGPGYEFADENLEGAAYPRGTLAMANSGPGTNGSQFFLVFGDSTFPPNFTPFGTITAGLDVLETVGAGGTTGSAPTLPVQIMSVEVAPQAG